MNPDELLRAEIRRLGPWHHDIQVAPGIRTGAVSKDVVYPPSFGAVTLIDPELWMARLATHVFPGGLNGRSVLDCACNGGGYLFAAAENGAGRCLGIDVRDHWIDQARLVARHRPGRELEFVTADVHSLAQMELEPFDITLFMGLFYHLPDPIACLRMAADRTSELLVLNTAYRPGKGDALVLNVESDTQVMSGVHRLAWMPTSEAVLREILRWCGFPHVRTMWARQGRHRQTHASSSSPPAKKAPSRTSTGSARAPRPRLPRDCSAASFAAYAAGSDCGTDRASCSRTPVPVPVPVPRSPFPRCSSKSPFRSPFRAPSPTGCRTRCARPHSRACVFSCRSGARRRSGGSTVCWRASRAARWSGSS